MMKDEEPTLDLDDEETLELIVEPGAALTDHIEHFTLDDVTQRPHILRAAKPMPVTTLASTSLEGIGAQVEEWQRRELERQRDRRRAWWFIGGCIVAGAVVIVWLWASHWELL